MSFDSKILYTTMSFDSKNLMKILDLMHLLSLEEASDCVHFFGEKIPCIYVLVNKLTGKKYVKQTSDYARTINEFLTDKVQAPIIPAALYDDLVLYGKENFGICLVEPCLGLYLNEREYFWITELDTVNTGYNNYSRAVEIKQNHNLFCKFFPEEEVAEFICSFKIKLDPFYFSKQFKDSDYIYGTDSSEEIDNLIAEIKTN